MPIKYDTLHKLYVARPSARELFHAIVKSGVEDGRTTVDEVIVGSAATRRQAITLLRDLDEARCGEFKVGRKGHPSRLEWSADPREIVRRAIGEKQVSAAPADAANDAAGEQRPSPAAPAAEPDTHDPLDTRNAEARDHSSADLAVTDTLASADLEGKAETGHDDWIEHRYVLRPDSRVSITLPADLTRREAEVLADWVRNLSFER